ncbi:hypothetical protein P8452_26858 [Trifolium repens]|nr:hypothetical protein P8452_26858 [Trifolium repens]
MLHNAHKLGAIGAVYKDNKDINGHHRSSQQRWRPQTERDITDRNSRQNDGNRNGNKRQRQIMELVRNRKRNQNQNRNRTLTQESELDSRPRLNWDWVSKREKDVELSDFSSFENHPTPFCYICPRFVYKNKAHKDEEEEREKALHEYKERSRNVTPFDAIPVPPKIQIMASNFPKPIGITNDEDHAFLTELSLIALAQYNADQGSNYDFDGLVKAASVGSYRCSPSSKKPCM